MKIAVISNVRHRRGDLMEYLLLRAVHVFHRFIPVDFLVIEGELTLGEPEPEFLQAFRASLALRKVNLQIVQASEAPEAIGPELFGPLLERIRVAVGGFPAFDAAPFEATVADVSSDGSIRAGRCAMVIPELPGVADFHIHTKMAYCSENMDIPKALEMARLSNVGTVAFSEHSGQLYFRHDDYWPGRYVWKTRDSAEGCRTECRIAEYAALLREGEEAGRFLHGFELDVDRNGDVILDDAGRRLAQVRLGAVHHLAERNDVHVARRQFLFCTEALLRYGVHILAHPFRIFNWSGLPPQPDLFRPVVELLARYNVAAEINFHQNEPELEFFELCLEKGVKLSLGSDSHNLYEVGFFLPHYRFLKELGVAGRLDEVLFQFQKEKR